MKNLNVILLVGGKGTRLNKFSMKNLSHTPKALRKINSNVLLAHVMKNFLKYKFNNFILPIGNYKSKFYLFFKNKKYFAGKKCSVFFNSKDYLKSLFDKDDRIKILLLDTGINTNKAERVLKVIKKLNLQEFVVSYGDGVGDIDLKKLYNQHVKSNSFMSVASFKPFSQYGLFTFSGKNKSYKATNFIEKPKLNDWANIGYFFCKKKSYSYFLKYSKNDLEMGVMKKLLLDKKLSVYKHLGFWKSVDTLKDIEELSDLIKK